MNEHPDSRGDTPLVGQAAVMAGNQPLSSVAVALPSAGHEGAFVWIERTLLLAGMMLFIALVWEIGLRALWEELSSVGYGLIPIIAQEVLVYLTCTIGWRYAFVPSQRTLPFRRLFVVRLVGDVINSVTPTATIGGEFMRARLLKGEIDSNAVWASIAVAAITQAVGQASFVIVGLVLLLPSIPVPTELRDGLLLAIVAFVIGIMAAVAIQRRGMLKVIDRVLRRLHIELPSTVTERMQALDAYISQFYAYPSSFALSASAFGAGWALGALEVYLILYFLEVPEISWRLACTIEALSVAIDGALFFVPGKLGTQEGGKVLIFSLLGLPPAQGLALGIIRRVRDLSWSAVGLLILSRHQLRRQAA